jgi:hypothetical protein
MHGTEWARDGMGTGLEWTRVGVTRDGNEKNQHKKVMSNITGKPSLPGCAGSPTGGLMA